jgi:hypothetical protein
MLIMAWQKHLPLSADRKLIETCQSEINQPATPLPNGSGSVGHHLWVQRTQQHFGLMEWVQYPCRRYKVDKLLIEAKASGISAAQELLNRYGRENNTIQLCPVKGDKIARALLVQPILSSGMVIRAG